MTEIEVKIAPRYIKRKSSNALGKSFLKTLTEPITNSDDSYRILMYQSVNPKEVYPIIIRVDKRNRLVRIIDNAEGMTSSELEDKFKEYGAAKSGAYKGYSTRGIFGQGISDVLFYHSRGLIKSIKNKEASVCSFYERGDKRFIKVDRQRGPTEKFAKQWGINCEQGTVVEFVADKDTIIHEYDNLVKKLSAFYMLRLINANGKRRIILIFIDHRGSEKRSIIKYHFPDGELVEHKKFTLQFENYDPVGIDVELYKSVEPLQTVGEERESGLLVSDDKETVYDLTFFGLDNLPGTDKFYGFIKLTGAREIILDKINNKKHPEEILTDSRDGFNKQHEFYKQLEGIMKDWLYPILNEEKKIISDSGLSEATKESHKKAFNELNKLYEQLTGEDITGTIRGPKRGRPRGGIEFARDNISITANKRYGLQLLIDTRVIKPGAIIKLVSHKSKIGFAPTQIKVTEPDQDADDILVKTLIVTGNVPGTADTLAAEYQDRRASVVVSIVSEEIVYPENGFGFNPDYFRAIAGRESALSLYVDLELINRGDIIKLASSNNSIKLKKTEVVVEGRLRSTNRITKLQVPFVGEQNDECGVIEAVYQDRMAQARVDVKDRIPIKPQGPTGKFKDWDFDETVPIPFQAVYDSRPGSSTQGYILINPNHPINKKFFGDNPRKSDIEKSLNAQLYLAELILAESLNVTIPEAIQKGTLPKRSDYDVLFYIAQKKYEYGPVIYSYFVEEESVREAKKKQLLETISKSSASNDQDITEGLEEREKQMIEMRFGLNEQRSHTLDEIGRKFGITKERARQIINQALARKYGDYSYAEEYDYDKKYDYIKKQEERISTTIDKIIKEVANFYNLEIDEIKKVTRKSNIVKPRQVTIYLLRQLMHLSFPFIGKIFNLDHTTVLYAFEKITDGIEKDPILMGQIASLKAIIQS